jgi:membrane associated rhomboid family serine protease
MFLPLHDQNNEPVRVVPYVCFGLMIITTLIFAYQMILEHGDEDLANMLILRHGLVSAPFYEGKTEFVFDILKEKGISDSDRPARRPPKQERIETPETPETPEAPPRVPVTRPKRKRRAILEPIKVQTTPLILGLTPLTYIFLHGGWMHLIGNLWFFWIFSDNVEERMGSVAFLLFYLAAGIAGGLLHVAFNLHRTIPLIGASGAVSGVMGAYVMLFPGNRITSYFCPIWFFIRRIDVPAYMVLGFYIIFNMFAMARADALGAGVAFDCHVGGFVVGILAGMLFKKR